MNSGHHLLIARHGNTFDKGDEIRRVGKRTDLPLSSSGQIQAHHLGQYLTKHYPQLNRVFCSSLQRTQQTAQAVLAAYQPQSLALEVRPSWDEIDYGPDENQPETAVLARLGADVLTAWDEQQLIPEGWRVDINALHNSWQQFSAELTSHTSAQTWLVITSQGIARFAETLLPLPLPTRKLATTAVSHFSYQQGQWQLEYWNRKP